MVTGEVRHRLQRADGACRVVVRVRDGRTRLAVLEQRAPARVLMPTPEPDEPPEAVLITTTGGIADGDRLAQFVRVDPEARFRVATQAAEKIYRAAGADPARLVVRLDVAAGGRLDWLPQETILFDGARLDRRIALDLAGDARLVACDQVVFGRIARGERFQSGVFTDRWTVQRDGRLVWYEASALEAASLARLTHRFGWAGAESQGLMLVQAPDAAVVRDLLRDAIPGADDLRTGVTALNGLVILRLLGTARAVRRGLVAAILVERHWSGLTRTLPRVWHS